MVAEAGLGLLWAADMEFRATASCLAGGLTMREVSVGTGVMGDWVVPASHAFCGLVLHDDDEFLLHAAHELVASVGLS